MSVVINPGSGPVSDANEEDALANILKFAEELGTDIVHRQLGGEDEGRWPFLVVKDERMVQIDMPGIPLEKVRYTGADDQNPWNFPRLYVEGSSWLWCFGVKVAERILLGKDEDDD